MADITHAEMRNKIKCIGNNFLRLHSAMLVAKYNPRGGGGGGTSIHDKVIGMLVVFFRV